MTTDDARDIEIARKTVQVGVLEARVWELREELARSQRHRGAAVGLLRGAVKDGALSGEYVDLAAKVLLVIDDPSPFGHRGPTRALPYTDRSALAQSCPLRM